MLSLQGYGKQYKNNRLLHVMASEVGNLLIWLVPPLASTGRE